MQDAVKPFFLVLLFFPNPICDFPTGASRTSDRDDGVRPVTYCRACLRCHFALRAARQYRMRLDARLRWRSGRLGLKLMARDIYGYDQAGEAGGQMPIQHITR